MRKEFTTDCDISKKMKGFHMKNKVPSWIPRLPSWSVKSGKLPVGVSPFNCNTDSLSSLKTSLDAN